MKISRLYLLSNVIVISGFTVFVVADDKKAILEQQDPIKLQLTSVYDNCGPSKKAKTAVKICWQGRIEFLHKHKNDKAALAVLDECASGDKFTFTGVVKEEDQRHECLSPNLITEKWPSEENKEATIELPSMEVSVPRRVGPHEANGEEIGKARGRCDGTSASKVRLERLEQVPELCLNNPCDAAKDWDACSALERLDLEKFASKAVLGSLAYIDADSLVFLTRAAIADLILKSYEGKTGSHFAESDIPEECRNKSELLNGLKPSSRGSIPHYKHSLDARLPELKKVALEISEIYEKRNQLSSAAGGDESSAIAQKHHEMSSLMLTLIVRNPELIPRGYKGDEQLQVALGLASLVKKHDEDESSQLEFLRKNLTSSVQLGLKHACSMDFKDLLRIPMARAMAQRIAQSLTLVERDEAGRKSSRIWTCLKNKVDEPGPSDVASEACWSFLTGVSVGLAVSGLGTPAALAGEIGTYACVGLSETIHALDILHAEAEQELNWSCVNSANLVCDEATQKAASQKINAAVRGLAFDAAMLPLGRIAEPVLGVFLKPVAKALAKRFSPLGAEWIAQELLKIDEMVKAGIKTEVEKEVKLLTQALAQNVVRSPKEAMELELQARFNVAKKLLSGELKPPTGAVKIRIRTPKEMAEFEEFFAGLSDEQKQAIYDAHFEPSLKKKTKMLADAKIPDNFRRDLIEGYVCGGNKLSPSWSSLAELLQPISPIETQFAYGPATPLNDFRETLAQNLRKMKGKNGMRFLMDKNNEWVLSELRRRSPHTAEAYCYALAHGDERELALILDKTKYDDFNRGNVVNKMRDYAVKLGYAPPDLGGGPLRDRDIMDLAGFGNVRVEMVKGGAAGPETYYAIKDRKSGKVQYYFAPEVSISDYRNTEGMTVANPIAHEDIPVTVPFGPRAPKRLPVRPFVPKISRFEFPEHSYPIPEDQYAAIENNMRPGVLSESGFIARKDSLREVLAADDATVKARKSSHKKIAVWLNRVIEAANESKTVMKRAERVFRIVHVDGREIWVEKTVTGSGGQESPFGDDVGLRFDAKSAKMWERSTWGDNYNFFDPETGQEIMLSEAHPYMIGNYGFYEGNVPYRLSPDETINMMEGKGEGVPATLRE